MLSNICGTFCISSKILLLDASQEPKSNKAIRLVKYLEQLSRLRSPTVLNYENYKKVVGFSDLFLGSVYLRLTSYKRFHISTDSACFPSKNVIR